MTIIAEESVKDFLVAFKELSIPFMVVGSFSSNFFGVPRSTEDADFVIEVESTSVIDDLRRNLSDKYTCDGQKSFEFVTGTTDLNSRETTQKTTFRLNTSYLS